MESIAFIQWCLDNLNYWTVTLLMTIESSFIPFPSEVVVPPAAWLAATGSTDLNIYLVVLFATLGACIGALVNYYLALWLGRPIIYKFVNSRVGHMCLLDEEKLKHAEVYFEKHGSVSTLVGRLIPAVRQLISIPAGLARMKIGKFILFTSLGAGVWNAVLAIIGWSLVKVPGIQTKEQLLERVSEYSHVIGYSILAVVVVVLAVLIYKGYRKR
ncbi:MAG: DedA family protein [Muribaculaceae bacterium]|nr:DedA family protein [Muribaculaceae bacterium]